MSVEIKTSKLGLEDFQQSAASTTFNRSRKVGGVVTTAPVTGINAGNMLVLDDPSQLKVTKAGGAATYPGPAIGELAGRVRQAVADVAALRTVPTANAVARQAVWVESKQTFYAWSSTGVLADDGNYVIAPNDVGGGAGRWHKQTAGTADTFIRHTSLANLKAATVPPTGTMVHLTGYGVYRYDAASAAAAEDFNVIAPNAGGGRYLLELVDKAKMHGGWIPTSDTDPTSIANAIAATAMAKYASIAVLKTQAGMADDSLAFVETFGHYMYNSASTTASDSIFVVRPDSIGSDATPGRWIHAIFAIKAANSGLATLTAAGKLAQSPADGSLATALLAANAVSQVVQSASVTSNLSTTSTTWADLACNVGITTVGGVLVIYVQSQGYISSNTSYLGVRVNGVDYPVAVNLSTAGHSMNGIVFVSGLAAGTYTVQLRGKVFSSGTLTLYNGADHPTRITAIELKR
jgi:hypothetical protein